MSTDDDTAKYSIRLVLTGAIWSIFSAFPIAGLMALVFRFPVPFGGYYSGFEAVIPAMQAVVFYGIFMGGLVLVGALGAVNGALTARLTAPVRRHQQRAIRMVSLAITTICLFVLAILDKIVGPW